MPVIQQGWAGLTGLGGPTTLTSCPHSLGVVLGPPPVFFGFGSAVSLDPVRLTNKIVRAIKELGIRAIIQRGWAGLAEKLDKVPENILIIDSIPHNWLFPRCDSNFKS